MNPIDRINQLNDEIAILRSQLFDARTQLEADSATIAKLANDKRELFEAYDELKWYTDSSSAFHKGLAEENKRLLTDIGEALKLHPDCEPLKRTFLAHA